jgi:parallel beta-helix repeat protein
MKDSIFFHRGRKVMVGTPLVRKGILIGIILAWLIVSVIPSPTSAHTLGKTIITVDDEPGDADYTSIKEAVNHSTPGTIIEIYSGTYDEQEIVISLQNLTLKGIPQELGTGNDTGKPVVELSQLNANYLFFINASSFSLLGCVLIGGSWVSSEVYAQYAAHLTLSNNDIFSLHSPGISVYLFVCDYLQILNNTVTRSDNGSSVDPYGFYIYSCDYALVQNNTFRNGYAGILAIRTRNCSILNNQVTNTNADAAIKVVSVAGYPPASSNITISQNTVTNCSATGIWVYAVNNISILHNHVSVCRTGMVVDTVDSIIENNTLERCQTGLYLSCGQGDNNTFTSNQVQNNGVGMILRQVGNKLLQVTRNNFIHNLEQVVITVVIPTDSNNIFRGNYWNRPLFHPKPVICFGLLIIFPKGLFIGVPVPWICFDLTPAQHSYDIP